MRVWGGERRDISNVGGQHMTDVGGVLFDVEGELRRRSGLEHIVSLSSVAMGTFAPANGSPKIINMRGDGNVDTWTVTETATTTVDTDYNADFKPVFASTDGRAYYTNDYDRVQVHDGTSNPTAAGIAGPTATMGSPAETSGNVTDGTHLVRYRYIDSAAPIGDGYGYRSNPCPELEYTTTLTSGASLIFSAGTATTNDIIMPSSSDRATGVRVEMTAAGGTTFYEVSEHPKTDTSVTVNLSDTTLQEQTLVVTSTEDGHLQPPGCRSVVVVGERAFYLGAHDHTITGASVTSDSQTVTYDGLPEIWQGRNVRFGSDSKVYQIESVASASFTLANEYTGSTDTAATGLVIPRNPNRVAYSHAFLPESVPALNAFDALQGTGDRLIAGAEYAGQLLLMGRRTMERRFWVQSASPGLGDSVRISSELGVWNQRCIVRVDDSTLYGWGPRGVWRMAGGAPAWISDPVDEHLDDLLPDDPTEAQAEAIFGVYDPQRRVIRWYFQEDGSSSVLRCLALDINKGRMRWSIDENQLPVDCGVTAAGPGGKAFAYLGSDDRDRVYRVNEAWSTDGVDSSSNGIYTAAAGCTSTVTQVDQSLPVDGLIGATLYVPSTGETVAITDNDASSITHAALAAALSDGDDAYAGSIPVELQTSWVTANHLTDKFRVAHLAIEVAAGSDAPSAEVRYYQDYSTTAVTLTNIESRALPRGVTLGSDGRSFDVDLDSDGNNGAVFVPVPADWTRSLRAKVTIYEPGTVRILDVRFDMREIKQGGRR